LAQTRLLICVDLSSAIWLVEFEVVTLNAKLHTDRKKWTRRLESDSIKEIRGFDHGYWDNRLLWQFEVLTMGTGMTGCCDNSRFWPWVLGWQVVVTTEESVTRNIKPRKTTKMV